tara:strand:- start:6715 stop:6912 length:198 start_codon:yes stop_codon:yes gene_type:complete
MQVNSKTDKLNKCSCGHKPDGYWIGYSRTPYYLTCKCGKHVGDYGGSPQNIIDAWNEQCDVIYKK